jgi:hypothetical protein
MTMKREDKVEAEKLLKRGTPVKIASPSLKAKLGRVNHTEASYRENVMGRKQSIKTRRDVAVERMQGRRRAS